MNHQRYWANESDWTPVAMNSKRLAFNREGRLALAKTFVSCVGGFFETVDRLPRNIQCIGYCYYIWSTLNHVANEVTINGCLASCMSTIRLITSRLGRTQMRLNIIVGCLAITTMLSDFHKHTQPHSWPVARGWHDFRLSLRGAVRTSTVYWWDPPDHSTTKPSDPLLPPESKTKIYFRFPSQELQ